MLVGKANPKTLIAPLITAPTHDINFWRKNNLVNHSGVNTSSAYDPYASGYLSSAPPTERRQPQSLKEGYEKCLAKEDDTPTDMGVVNRSLGHDSSTVAQAWPTNIPASDYYLDQEYKDYNYNLFTNIIQPGVYVHSEIIEPISSNIGISYNAQFQPTTIDATNGSVLITQRDPTLPTPSYGVPIEGGGITEHDVYDPRHYGYGDGTRSYIEPMTGQVRFMYDDVDAVRNPNYIVRSNIDFASYSDQYGSIKDGWAGGNPNTDKIREMANQSFIDATIQNRVEYQHRWMAKANARKLQTRIMPKRG